MLVRGVRALRATRRLATGLCGAASAAPVGEAAPMRTDVSAKRHRTAQYHPLAQLACVGQLEAWAGRRRREAWSREQSRPRGAALQIGGTGRALAATDLWLAIAALPNTHALLYSVQPGGRAPSSGVATYAESAHLADLRAQRV